MKLLKWSLGIIPFVLVLFFACQKSGNDNPGLTSAAGKTTKMSKLTLDCYSSSAVSITLKVTAGATGAPAGVSIQWMKKTDFEAQGNVWVEGTYCKVSLSGVPGCADQYKIPANGYIYVKIGENLFDDCGASSTTLCFDGLTCGTDYVFRAFAHNDPVSGIAKGDFSNNTVCSTSPCTEVAGCTYTQGFWKTHGPVPVGNNSYVWPQDIQDNGMTLGTVTYTADQLLSIFNQPAQGNGLLTLAHQLIAAKLNIANGSDGSAVATAIADADALIGSLIIPPVGSGYLSTASTSSLVTNLTSYNEGSTGPGHCN